MKALLTDRWARFGLAIIGLYLLAALLSAAGLLPLDETVRATVTYAPPGAGHWLGTDYLGRDVLAKLVGGARIALSVGLIASLIAIPIGAGLGLAAGYFGGIVDEIVVWLFSSLTAIPQILLLTAMSFVLGRGVTAIYIAVGLTSWVGICRLVRAETMKLKNGEYVLAARALGTPDAVILLRHILPNLSHLLILDVSLRFAYAIKSEAILSYLGLGVQGRASWGVMIADARQELLRGIWWQLAGATAAMFFLVLAFNVVGDALRDRLYSDVSKQT